MVNVNIVHINRTLLMCLYLAHNVTCDKVEKSKEEIARKRVFIQERISQVLCIRLKCKPTQFCITPTKTREKKKLEGQKPHSFPSVEQMDVVL